VFKQPPLLPLSDCVLIDIRVDVPTTEGELVFHIDFHQPTILTGPHSELRTLYFAGWVQRQEPEHRLLGVEGVGLRAEAAGGGAGSVEVAAQSRSQERAEDDLGTLEGGKGQPQEENKLESVVEGEPVDNADEALNDSEERKDNPVGKPLSVVRLVGTEESGKGEVSREDEARNVGQELAAEVEDDQKEVERAQAEHAIGLGDRGLLLEVVEHRVLGELFIDLRNKVLDAVLRRRHGGDAEL
jgi:hypothetical protein